MTAVRRRRIAAALFAVPVVLLGGGLAWLLMEHGLAAFGTAAVHEDGRRTLLATIFYPRHFLREVIPSALVAAACIAAFRAYGPQGEAGARRSWAGWVALALVLGSFGAAALEAGFAVAAGDLLQLYTRDDDVAWGSHWRSHVLAVIALVAAAVVGAALLGRWLDGGWRRAARRSRLELGGVIVAIAALTLVCGPSLEPLTAARVVGHQARELATHGTITLAIAFAVLLWRHWPPAPAPARRSPRPPREVRLAAGIAATITAYLLATGLMLDARAAGPPGAPLSALLAAHGFEHSLDYLFVALLCAAARGARL